jgi:Cu/Ag efflux pump CusA
MDEVAIAALLYRYARAAETKDWELYRSVFTDDAYIDYNLMQLPGLSEMSSCGGYYHHELVRTPDGWRSRHLREENVWFVNSPAGAPDVHM